MPSLAIIRGAQRPALFISALPICWLGLFQLTTVSTRSGVQLNVHCSVSYVYMCNYNLQAWDHRCQYLHIVVDHSPAESMQMGRGWSSCMHHQWTQHRIQRKAGHFCVKSCIRKYIDVVCVYDCTSNSFNVMYRLYKTRPLIPFFDNSVMNELFEKMFS